MAIEKCSGLTSVLLCFASGIKKAAFVVFYAATAVMTKDLKRVGAISVLLLQDCRR